LFNDLPPQKFPPYPGDVSFDATFFMQIFHFSQQVLYPLSTFFGSDGFSWSLAVIRAGERLIHAIKRLRDSKP
jgi:hypothetical protein